MSFLNAILTFVFGVKGMAFLDTQLINTPFIYLDLWNFPHFFVSFLIGFTLVRFKKVKIWHWVVFNIIFEVYEFFSYGTFYKGHHLLPDSVWDIGIDVAGFVMGQTIVRKELNLAEKVAVATTTMAVGGFVLLAIVSLW